MLKRNRTATQHNFAVIPGPHLQRSKFRMTQTRKQAFNASELIPIMCEEVLPGDTWQHTETIAARLATPIAPAVDNLYMETWYFFTPNRITWEEWEDFISGVNTSVTIPTVEPHLTGTGTVVLPNSVFDHFGLLPQTTTTNPFKINVLPIWAYFMIYNEWFRDQNLQEEWTWSPTWTNAYSDAITQNTTGWDQSCLRANKPHDYFTASLPWPQKGTAVALPLGTTAPVESNGLPAEFWDGLSALNVRNLHQTSGSSAVTLSSAAGATSDLYFYQNATGLQVDLSAATAATINQLRQAATMQQLLEIDARGGSRYVEQLLAHFGVRAPDFRLQRPEYLGGSRTPITVNPIAQTAAYDAEPSPTDPSAIGNLGAEMHVSSHKRTFTYAAVEHGYVIGLACVRATPTYQQGTRRHWRRQTRADFYWPTFANIGEQAVATQEIYQPANNAPTADTWGYQERSAEYRYTPNEITGVLRSTAAQPLDWWHYSEKFATEPALNASFITDKTQETLARSLATAPSAQWSAQIIMDINHDSVVARLMPAYSVPGITRF